MDWHPISLEELNIIVASGIEAMACGLQKKFNAISGKFVQIDCKRSSAYGLEKIFIVATYGRRAIIYDDVEEEFGIAVLPEHKGVLLRWDLYPDLGSAVRGLFESAVHPKTGGRLK